LGKSTLFSNIKKLAVLAIDPSSQRSGAVFCDKTRMEVLSYQPNVYIRPSPAGNLLAGWRAIPAKVLYFMLVLAVFIETVV